jgi:hypothetical protein
MKAALQFGPYGGNTPFLDLRFSWVLFVVDGSQPFNLIFVEEHLA